MLTLEMQLEFPVNNLGKDYKLPQLFTYCNDQYRR